MRNRRWATDNVLDSLYYSSENSKVLVKMQTLRTMSSRKSFTKAEQDFDLSLFYKSPSAYKFLRNNKKIT